MAMASLSEKPRVPASFGGAADGPRAGLGQVLGGGELCEDAAGPGAEQIAEGRTVLRQHHVELRDELAQIILPVGQEPGAQPRELAQALDLLVGHVTGLGHPRPQQARDEVGIDVIRLGLAADHVPVTPGLQWIQHEDAVARADERRFQVFPEVAGGLEPEQGLRRRCAACGQRPHPHGHTLLARGDGEARADCFTVTIQDGNCNRTLRLRTRGIATTLAGAFRS
jgi:hypothetical protein